MGAAASTSPQAAAAVVDGHEAILGRAQGKLLARPALAAALQAKLGEGGVCAVLAPSGSGKSTFVAQAVAHAADAYDVVHSVFVGGAAGSTNLVRVLQALCDALARDLERFELDAPPPRTEDVLGLSGALSWRAPASTGCTSSINSLPRSLATLHADGKKCLLTFDAVNELDGEAARGLGWLPKASPATVLLSAIKGGAHAKDGAVTETLEALKFRFGIDAENALLPTDLDAAEQAALLELSTY